MPRSPLDRSLQHVDQRFFIVISMADVRQTTKTTLMKIRYLLVATLTSLLVSCTANTFDDLEPVQPDVVGEVTFQDVKFVFDNICQQCHSNPPQNGAPMPLVTFAEVREAVQNRGLIDRISRQDGEAGLMPLGGPRLPQTTIDLIIQWEQDGLLEN